MILVTFTAILAVCGAAKLDRSYLPPPPSAKTAGGSPGALQPPPSSSISNAPKGAFPNENEGIVVDAAIPGSRTTGQEESGLGLPRENYGSSASKVGSAAFENPAGFRKTSNQGSTTAEASSRPQFNKPEKLSAPASEITNQQVGGAFSQSQFSLQSQGQFGQQPQGQFEQQSQGQFVQHPQGQFVQKSQGQFEQQSQGQFVQKPQGQFVQQSQGQFVQKPQVPGFGGNIVVGEPQQQTYSRDHYANTVRYQSDVGPNKFSYAFETDNGISAEENGVEADGIQSQGGYAYTADDGQVYSVSYVADQDGFRPVGAHLPTPPPIPEEILKSLQQNAQEEAAGIVDDGSYDAQKHNAEGEYTETNNEAQYNHQPSTPRFGFANGKLTAQNKQPSESKYGGRFEQQSAPNGFIQRQPSAQINNEYSVQNNHPTGSNFAGSFRQQAPNNFIQSQSSNESNIEYSASSQRQRPTGSNSAEAFGQKINTFTQKSSNTGASKEYLAPSNQLPLSNYSGAFGQQTAPNSFVQSHLNAGTNQKYSFPNMPSGSSFDAMFGQQSYSNSLIQNRPDTEKNNEHLAPNIQAGSNVAGDFGQQLAPNIFIQRQLNKEHSIPNNQPFGLKDAEAFGQQSTQSNVIQKQPIVENNKEYSVPNIPHQYNFAGLSAQQSAPNSFLQKQSNFDTNEKYSAPNNQPAGSNFAGAFGQQPDSYGLIQRQPNSGFNREYLPPRSNPSRVNLVVQTLKISQPQNQLNSQTQYSPQRLSQSPQIQRIPQFQSPLNTQSPITPQNNVSSVSESASFASQSNQYSQNGQFSQRNNAQFPNQYNSQRPSFSQFPSSPKPIKTQPNFGSFLSNQPNSVTNRPQDYDQKYNSQSDDKYSQNLAQPEENAYKTTSLPYIQVTGTQQNYAFQPSTIQPKMSIPHPNEPSNLQYFAPSVIPSQNSQHNYYPSESSAFASSSTEIDPSKATAGAFGINNGQPARPTPFSTQTAASQEQYQQQFSQPQFQQSGIPATPQSKAQQDSYYYNRPARPFDIAEIQNSPNNFQQPLSSSQNYQSSSQSSQNKISSSNSLPSFRPSSLNEAYSSNAGITQASASSFGSQSQASSQKSSQFNHDQPEPERQQEPNSQNQFPTQNFEQAPTHSQRQPSEKKPSKQYDGELYEYNKPAEQSTPKPELTSQEENEEKPSTVNQSLVDETQQSTDISNTNATPTQQYNGEIYEYNKPEVSLTMPFQTQASQLNTHTKQSHQEKNNQGSSYSDQLRPQFPEQLNTEANTQKYKQQPEAAQELHSGNVEDQPGSQQTLRNKPAVPFGQRLAPIQQSPQRQVQAQAQAHTNFSFSGTQSSNSAFGRGETFSGPRQPPHFDSNGYHY